ncbi:MAG TPA: molybdopterin-dependent oxidoreductase [Gemmataceae bacterium]|nr:molybdopterin-dependent oxidoreductase [Gemmataceae bacterium]
MATVFVNNKPVDIGNDKLNCIQAAARAGIQVPSYCWHPALTVVASCRMCLVEVGEKKDDGTIAMQPKVVPGCQTPVKDKMVIVTDSPKAKSAQAQTLEDILLNHPLDCPVCDKAGECLLQDFSFKFGHATSRMIDVKNTPPNKPQLSSKITLFTDRCIMCSRCVRFTREISGTAELQVINRGHHSEIDVFPGQPLENKLAGNVVDLCPVGALGSKDFLYKQRVWYLQQKNSVCPNCSTGCSIYLDTNKDIIYRLRPRENPQAQGYFMCDEGRLGYHYVNSPERLRRPLARKDGQSTPTSWRDLLPAIRRDLAEIAPQQGSKLVGVLSPFLTCEEAFLLAKYLKSLSPAVKLALGPVPVIGEDDTYPKDFRGRPKQPVKFTIHAEKCPNRKGVEAVLQHFQKQVPTWPGVLKDAAAGQVKALFWTGGYPAADVGASAAEIQALQNIEWLLVQDFFTTALSARANYALPATSFAEKEGTFINHANLAQTIHRAIHPPQEARTEGQVYLDLMERRGLIQPAEIRREMAQEIPYFARLAQDLGGLGIRLSSNA